MLCLMQIVEGIGKSVMVCNPRSSSERMDVILSSKEL